MDFRADGVRAGAEDGGRDGGREGRKIGWEEERGEREREVNKRRKGHE
jgi:hypothetical protein